MGWQGTGKKAQGTHETGGARLSHSRTGPAGAGDHRFLGTLAAILRRERVRKSARGFASDGAGVTGDEGTAATDDDGKLKRSRLCPLGIHEPLYAGNRGDGPGPAKNFCRG